MSGELDLLARAHALFSQPVQPPALTPGADDIRPIASTGALAAAYRDAAATHQVQGAEHDEQQGNAERLQVDVDAAWERQGC